MMCVLNRGSTGEQVRELQRNLIAVGYDCGNIDGFYGAVTESAVRFFQADHDLTPDGEYGPDTQAVMASELKTERLWKDAALDVSARLDALEKRVAALESAGKGVDQ